MAWVSSVRHQEAEGQLGSGRARVPTALSAPLFQSVCVSSRSRHAHARVSPFCVSYTYSRVHVTSSSPFPVRPFDECFQGLALKRVGHGDG